MVKWMVEAAPTGILLELGLPNSQAHESARRLREEWMINEHIPTVDEMRVLED
jgi:hypothetical protein